MHSSRRVRVVTDSTADLPPEMAARWGIVVVPLYVHLGEKTFRDGVDLESDGFAARLSQGEFPTTSQPSIGTMKRIYEQAAAGGGDVISIHLSAGLSGTYQSAILAADQVDGRVMVIDSGLLSMGLGWLVLAAAQAAREGRSLEDVVASVEELRKRAGVLALIENLEYLRRGGRIGRAQEAVGSLLDIRPIITLRDGEVVLLERVRTRRAGLRRLVELASEAGQLQRLAVLHVGRPDDARQVADDLAPVFPREDLLIVPAGQVVAAHVGPEAVGVGYVVAR